jgi:hypothetical protein
VANEIRKRNRADAKALFRYSIQESINRIAGTFAAIADLPETTPDEVRAKEAAYAELRRGDDWERAKWACDLWTAAFFVPLTKDGGAVVPTTRHVWEAAGGRQPQGLVAGLIGKLAAAQPFFNWPVEFPEVFTGGGFDVMLGNPPWERIKLAEKEFFATRDRDIAEAPNKAARERLIKALSDPDASEEKRALAREWAAAKHSAECESKFLRESARYEAKMFWHFDHRWSSFEDGETVAPTDDQKAIPSFQVQPRYWISKTEATNRLADMSWNRPWLLACRNISDSRNERTFVASVLPFCGLGNSGSALFVDPKRLDMLPLLLANLNALVFDYVAKQKIPGTNINYFMIEQLPALAPDTYSSKDINFIKPRVVELTYTAEDLKPFAVEFGFAEMTPSWAPHRRERVRAELDAYYAYLYGLTRRELEYVLDPKAVMGEDYPSESFRVLEENELRKFHEYRTKRLVLEAWDRSVADGTFDPVRLREPQYIDRVADELTATRARLEQVEHDSKALLALASATPTPTLFVEGVTDAKILEAAWAVFFPSEPMPVKVIAAGGTKEMGSLAGKGKALREILGEQVVLVLADNDSAGRALIDDGHTRKGGLWRPLPSGIHWCLLKPTDAFAAAMKTHAVPAAYWPFTIEAAFSPALRRQALAAGAYKFSGDLQAELFENPDVARRLVSALPKLGPDDDAYWYLMAPHPEAKDAFAAWVTYPKRRIEENYAGFEEIVRGLRAVLAPRSNNSEATTRARGAA